MNLEWLIAVLQPHDLFPRTGAPSELSDAQRLAALVVGDNWRLVDHSRLDQPTSAEWESTADLAGACFDAGTVSEALPQLVNQILSGWIRNPAEMVAATLIASCVAAEAELFETCFDVLNHAERVLSADRSTESELLRVAVANQLSLRSIDAGLGLPESHYSLLGRLAILNMANCTSFTLADSGEQAYIRTIGDIRNTLLGSVASLIVRRSDGHYDETTTEILANIRSAPITRNEWRIQQLQALVLSKHLRTEFEKDFRSRTRYIGGSAPDLYNVALLAELSGNQVVFELRGQLAQLRLVGDLDNALQVSDSLRSFRHAAAFSDLDLALRRLVDGGPAAAIVQDARRILGNSFRFGALRTVDARVLGAAADFMALGDLKHALNSITETLRNGGPPDLPFRWQLPVLRRQVVWEAGSAIAAAGGLGWQWSAILLRDVLSVEADDQILDGALAPALSAMDWGEVKSVVYEDWQKFIKEHGLNACAGQVPAFTRDRNKRADPATLDGVIDLLNDSLRGDGFPVEAVDPARLLVEGLLLDTREQASRGAYSFGGASPADIAVGMSIILDVPLWPSVVDFLVDSSVQQQDKAAALERLARWPGPLNEPTRELFSIHADGLLETRIVSPFEPEDLNVFPAALRFLSRHDLISRAKTINRIAGMASSRDQHARREAAMTLGLLSHVSPRDDLLPYALMLSSDYAPTVRASAGRALASLSLLEGELGSIAEEKLDVLLSESGVLVPTVILFGLEESRYQFSTRVMLRVVRLSESHPAKSVRRKAREAAEAHGRLRRKDLDGGD